MLPKAHADAPSVVFMFPGQGAQHVDMGRALYDELPTFRKHVDAGAELLQPILELDIRELLYPPAGQRESTAERLRQTVVTQPVMFVVEHALSRLWKEWGVEPDAMIGHSVGEYAAACLAGVFSFEDTVHVLATRARLMQERPSGGMLAVRLPAKDLEARLAEPLALAAANAPRLSVVSGPRAALAELQEALEVEGVKATRLHTSHAYHSSMMDEVLAPFAETVAGVTRKPPAIPWVSSSTGTWITPELAVDPRYWAEQLRRTVRFSDGVTELLKHPGRIFLEVGPGTTLSTFTQQHLDSQSGSRVIASLGHAQSRSSAIDTLLEAADRVASAGARVDWERVSPGGRPREDAPSNTVGRLISAQLEVMRRQLEVLQECGRLPPPGAREPAKPLGAVSDANEDAPPKPFGAVARIDLRSAELPPSQRAWLDELVARYTARTAKSRSFTERHRPVLADPRVVSGFTPVLKELVYPIVVERAAGSRLWDLDGNEYVDMINGFGSNFLGHGTPVVVEAVRECLELGYAIGPQHPFAGEVARLMSELTGHERTAFCNTGSEAVLGAVRAARTVTGRSRIVLFRDSYHGIFDEVVVRGVAALRSVPAAAGIPRSAVEETLVLDYGDERALQVIREQASTIAAVLVEPVQSRHLGLQPREFLHRLREITRQEGIALVFDEIITGFRVRPGGAQAYFGVRADMATYGKVVGGGLPIGLIAGDPRFLDALDGGSWSFGDDSFPEVGVTYFAGTFVRHPLALAAAKSVLTHLRTEGGALQERVTSLTTRCVRKLEEACADLGAPVRFEQFSSVFQLYFTEDAPFGALLFPLLREQGIHMFEGRSWFLTAAHSEDDVALVVDGFRRSLAQLLEVGLLPKGAGADRAAVTAGPGGGSPPTPGAPPMPGARLGRDPAGHPGWFRPYSEHAHKFVRIQEGGPLGPDRPEESDATVDFDPFADGALVDWAPSTEAQREIFASAFMGHDASAAYNETLDVTLRGSVDAGALAAALGQVIMRHDALRLSFAPDGLTFIVAASPTTHLEEQDLTSEGSEGTRERLAAVRDAQVAAPFDLVRGPLLRARLCRAGPDEHHLLLTCHHVICDGWSLETVLHDLGELYAAFVEHRSPEVEPAPSFVDYARARAAEQASDEYREDARYWTDSYRTPPSPLELPRTGSRPPFRTYDGARIELRVPPEATADLRRVGAGTTFMVTLLASFKSFLARITGAEDIVVGVSAAGQAFYGLPGLVGHCVNLLPVRTRVARDNSFTDVLRSVHGVLLDAQDHQRVTFGSLLARLDISRDPGRIPLVPVAFNLDTPGAHAQFGPATEVTVRSVPRRYETFEWFVNAVQEPDGLVLQCTFNTNLFEQPAMERLLRCFVEHLTGAAADPGRTVATLPLLPPEDRRLVSEWNATSVEHPPHESLHELIREQVERTPDAVAVQHGDMLLSYRDLADRATSFAYRLAASGVGAGDLVGVCVSRSCDMVVALLGVLETGAAYVPLDPTYPEERIAFILDDAAVRVLVAESSLAGPAARTDLARAAARADLTVILLDEEDRSAEPQPLPSVGHDDLAYVIYTSGSTGRPKGVEIPHRALVNFLDGTRRKPGLSSDDVLLAVTTIAFDISALELWLPLTTGAKVHIAPAHAAGDPQALAELLRASGATALQATPATWRVLIEAGWSGSHELRALCGGEALPRELTRALLPRVGELWNMYGPTETTIWSAAHRVRAVDDVVVGRPMQNTRFYVLSPERQLLPVGAQGELWIGGSGVARGYHRRPDLTAERFLLDPFAEEPGARMYRTGDCVRWRADGTLDFLGRLDHQVKIRGFRIELGEVESVLRLHDAVREAVVTTTESPAGERQLVAYVVPEPGRAPTTVEMRDFLGGSLPDYMVPSAFLELDRIPLTPNGKVDRKALPDPSEGLAANEAGRHEAPEGEMERTVAGVWERVLGREGIGRGDDFFRLGGHSILAARVVGLLGQEHGLQVPVRDVFEAPVLKDFAALLEAIALLAAASAGGRADHEARSRREITL